MLLEEKQAKYAKKTALRLKAVVEESYSGGVHFKLALSIRRPRVFEPMTSVFLSNNHVSSQQAIVEKRLNKKIKIFFSISDA